MISMTIWQMFELLVGTVAFLVFLTLLLLLSVSGRMEGGRGLSGCCIVILLPLGLSGIFLILAALFQAT